MSKEKEIKKPVAKKKALAKKKTVKTVAVKKAAQPGISTAPSKHMMIKKPEVQEVEEEAPEYEVKAVDEILKEVTWAEQFDWGLLCRIKKRCKLWMPLGSPHASGMVAMHEFLVKDKNRCIVHKRNVVRLDQLTFTDNEGKEYKIVHVMDCINENFKLEEVQGINKHNVKKVMERIFPAHHPDKFQPSHALLVLKWWHEVKTKVELMEDDEIVKTETDEK